MAKKTLKSNKAVEKKTAAKEESKTKVVDMKKAEQPTVKAGKKAEPKVEPKKAVEKKAEAKATKEEPKKIVAKAEPKKLTAKEEAKKLTTAKEPKKIAAAKEPKKIAAKEEPVKLEEVKPAVKEEAKKAETKATKKAPAKKAAPKAETKATKKAEPAKAVKKAEEKPAKKAEKKAPAKKVTKKKVDQEKLDHYNALPLDECIRLMQTMNVHYNYEDYYNLLLDEADLATLEKNIIDGNTIKDFKFAEVGCDEDLVMVTLNKVGDTMDIKAADYKDLKKAINSAIKFKMKDDAEANAAEYLDEFKLSEKLLMIGQRKNMFNASEVSELLGGDVVAYFKHFFDFAYALLPTWQYDDVKFYEDFAYAVLSQYADLFETEQLRIQIDVADLYVKHGDYQHGDEMYGYILRDNQIKDYIYYRYASVYKDIDFNKAKSIAYSSLQYVDDRYTYYPNIMEIINN